MTSIQGPEVLVDACISKLKAGLAERVAQINAEAADNIVITTPQDADYYTALIDLLPHAPSIIVWAGPAQWTGEGSHSFIDVAYDLCVYVLEEDIDRQNLGRRLQRQARAITEVLWDDAPREQAGAIGPNGQPSVWRLRPRTTTPSPLFSGEEPDSWRGYYLVIFQASMFEGD